ncbi:hypothetical protein KP509_08G018800 [Ceratopteris richardii]|uniref:Uncharacterized protein n=1 Tax=Ceratopteris richardii TaxID=49495 RepID=A0A8T2UC95_CERRI|nr:hypothetical protein KP509_08G018800 [Ceratopteris richardii]
MQFLDVQQKEERKATLAELEQSRHILLRRLKLHRGRDLPVIHDALSFVGEAIDDDGLPMTDAYPMPRKFTDADIEKFGKGSQVSMDDVRNCTELPGEEQQKSGELHEDNGTRPETLLSGLKHRISTFLNRRLVKTSAKCLFALAGAAAVLALSNSASKSANVRRGKEGVAKLRLKTIRCPENRETISDAEGCVFNSFDND